MWRIQWRESEYYETKTLEELCNIVDRIHKEHQNKAPVLAVIEKTETGESITIGLGAQYSVINYSPANANPPYLSSVGDFENDDVLEFWYLGHLSEIPHRNCISHELAKDALQYFVKYGKLTQSIKWEED